MSVSPGSRRLKPRAAAAVRSSEHGMERLAALLPSDLSEKALEIFKSVIGGGVVPRVRKALTNVEVLDELIRRNPSCTPLLALRGYMKRTGSEFEGAIQDLTEALRHHREPQAYFWRATAYGGLLRFAEAAADLDRAIELAPNCAEYYKMRGQAREKLGLLEEAIADFDRAIALRKSYDWAYIGRSVCLARLGRRREAIADLDKAIKLSKTEEWSYLKRSLLRRELGDVAGAIEDVNRACELNPGCDWILGKPPFADDHIKRAIEHLDGLLARQPRHAWALAWRGQTKLKLGDAAGARADLDLALKGGLGRGRGWVLAWRGEARRRLGELDGAIEDLDGAAKARPDYPRAFLWRGLAHADAGRGERALADLRRSVELDDRTPEALACLAEVEVKLGRLKDAEATLTRGLRTDPSDGAMLRARASVRARLGDVQGQVEDLWTSYARVQIDPQGWRRVRAELEREAGAAADAVWARLPIPFEVRLEQARELCERGAAAAALELLERAAACVPSPAARAALESCRGLALKRLGRLDESLAALNRALRLREEAAASAERPPLAGVDARVELLGGLQSLLEPMPTPGFARRLAPELAAYVEESRALFERLKTHDVVRLMRPHLGAGAHRWFPLASLMLSLGEPPGLEPLTRQADEFRYRELLQALRDAAGVVGFREFFDSRRDAFRRWTSGVAEALGGEDLTAALAEYLGCPVRADFAVVLSPAARDVSYSTESSRADGWVSSRTIVTPLDREEELRELLHQPSREKLLLKAWHELCHPVMDAWGERHAERFAEHEALYARVSGTARRTSWADCASEHFVLAPSCRLVESRLGAAAGKRALTHYKRQGYIYMDPVLERLRALEPRRARGASLAELYPEWLSALTELKP